MASILYQQFNQNNNNQNLVQKFNEFRRTFQGDPQQMVQQLLQSGRMSQSQYSQLRQMAQQFMQILQR